MASNDYSFKIVEINIDEFKNRFYDRFEEAFPPDERRKWDKISRTYNEGIEHFYKILLNDTDIGFIMLERINDNPYYIDYFAIYKEYQNNGYGSKAIKYLIKNIVNDEGIVGEIEKVEENNIQTIKRLEFYKKLGFTNPNSIYFLYDVYYTPIICVDRKMSKDEVDKILFDYYFINVGDKEELDKNCYIVE